MSFNLGATSRTLVVGQELSVRRAKCHALMASTEASDWLRIAP
jgi:hypothetical protein